MTARPAQADAVAQRLSVLAHEIEEVVARIDDHRSRPLAGRIPHDLPVVGRVDFLDGHGGNLEFSVEAGGVHRLIADQRRLGLCNRRRGGARRRASGEARRRCGRCRCQEIAPRHRAADGIHAGHFAPLPSITNHFAVKRFLLPPAAMCLGDPNEAMRWAKRGHAKACAFVLPMRNT